MSSAHTSSPSACHGINLVNKHNTGGILLRILKKISHPGCPHPDEHLHKIRSGNAEKGNSRLSGHSFRQQSLTGSRRADQNHPLGNPGSHTGVFLRIAEKIHHLLQIFFFFSQSSHVFKIHSAGMCHSGTALAEIHHPGIGSSARAGPHIHHND